MSCRPSGRRPGPIYTNGPIGGAFRGFGVPQAAIAQEALLDDVAASSGWIGSRSACSTPCGPGRRRRPARSSRRAPGSAACLEALRPAWDRANAEAAAANAAAIAATAPPIRRGVGIGAMWYGIGNTSLPNPSTVRIGLRRDGTYVLFSGAQEIGQGSNTVMTQIAADALDVPLATIALVTGDTDRTPDSGKTSASRQTFVSGNATKLAAEDLLRLMEVSGPDLALLAEDETGCVLVGTGSYDPHTTPARRGRTGHPVRDIRLRRPGRRGGRGPGARDDRVRRIVAAHDVGRAVNPMLVEGQIHGGIAQGLGWR